MRQSVEFYDNEGSKWLERNKKDIPINNDLVISGFSQLLAGIGSHNSVLEIGCSNGWRLREIARLFGCTKLAGIDPSKEAVEQAKESGLKDIIRGCAHSLPYPSSLFDIVIFGFCLYICDRDLLFEIAKEADRVLSDDGLLVIYDFTSTTPHKTKYKHKDGIWSYKQNYEDMFLWNPAYKLISSIYHRDGQTKATFLKKSLNRGWPEWDE